MDRIGINIGVFKTIIHTTSHNFKLLADELNNRKITTGICLTEPVRKFGNTTKAFGLKDAATYVDGFGLDLKNKDNIEYMYMYAKYLKRIIEGNDSLCKNVALTVPYHYDLESITKLVDIFELAGYNIKCVFNDTTAAAIGYLYNKKISQRILVLDFGHSKTSASIIESNEKEIKSVHNDGVLIGGNNFDKKMIEYLYNKKLDSYNKSKTTSEEGEYFKKSEIYVKKKLKESIHKFKLSLNNMSAANIKIELFGDYYKFELTTEEYENLIKDDLIVIDNFIKKYGKEKVDKIEVIGANIFNKYIKEILENNLKDVSYSMVYDECVSYGAAIGCALMTTKSNIKVLDRTYLNYEKYILEIVNNSDSLKAYITSNLNTTKNDDKNNDEKNDDKNESQAIETQIEDIKNIDLSNLNINNVYNKMLIKSDTDDTILKIYRIKNENKEEISKSCVMNKKNPFSIIYGYDMKKILRFVPVGDLQVDNANKLNLTHQEKESIKEVEKKYRKLEIEQIEIGSLRNKLESLRMKFNEKIRHELYKFDNKKIEEIEYNILSEYEYLDSSYTLQEETELFEEFLRKIEPYVMNMSEIFQDNLENLKIASKEIKEFTNKHKKYTTYKNDLAIYNMEINKKIEDVFDVNKEYNYDEYFYVDNVKIKYLMNQHLKQLKEDEERKKREEEVLEKMKKEQKKLEEEKNQDQKNNKEEKEENGLKENIKSENNTDKNAVDINKKSNSDDLTKDKEKNTSDGKEKNIE